MGEDSSYRPGCPVGPESLRRLTINYWDYTGAQARPPASGCGARTTGTRPGMGDRRSRWRPTLAPCSACATAGPADEVNVLRHAHWSVPSGWRTPLSAALVVTAVAALGVPWLDRTRSPALPPTEVLASQMRLDLDAAHRVQVGYLSTSWQDTEGTHHTLTGLPEIAARAASPGPDGRAARAGLARIDDALRALIDSDPQIAQQVAARVAHGVHPDVLATHLPAAHTLVHNQ